MATVVNLYYLLNGKLCFVLLKIGNTPWILCFFNDDTTRELFNIIADGIDRLTASFLDE